MFIDYDNFYSIKDMERITKLAFDAGWYFHSIEESLLKEKDHWFDTISNDYSNIELSRICDIINQNLIENNYNYYCYFNRHQTDFYEYTIISIRRINNYD